MKRLKLKSPIERWDEAIMLGNGMLGVLLWGNSRKIRLSLDRGDLWDERDNGLRRDPAWHCRTLLAAAAGEDHDGCDKLQRLASEIPATKLPAGRIELELAEAAADGTYELDLLRATGALCDRAGREIVSCFADANAETIYLKVAAPLRSFRIVPPDYQGKSRLLQAAGTVRSVGSLGYPPGRNGSSGGLKYYLQPCGDGLSYGIFAAELRSGEYAIKVIRADNMEELQQLAASPELFAAAGRAAAFRAHCRWWREFWRRSDVTLPEAGLQRHYELCRYFYGSASRPGAPPMPLQGIWTADDGSLPPWRGDFHHDLNTEFCYLGYLASGDFDCGESFFDHLVDRLPRFREFARNFFDMPGIAVPGITSLAGEALGGWPQYAFSPSGGIWLATMFADHWRYTMSETFLRERAMPFCRGIAEMLIAFLRRDDDGYFKLPFSCSPEIHDMEPESFLKPNSNYDQALLLRFFADLEELAAAAGEPELAGQAGEIRSHLAPPAVTPAAGLLLAPGEELRESHRHHSHLIAIWPLKLLTEKRDGRTIAASLHRLDLLGTGQWVGYSFSWLAGISAWCGRGDRAIRLLRRFLDSFVSRNGFHLNGDFLDHGDSHFKYRPFTLEGNFAAMQAVHEMLLHAEADEIRVFHALPEEWRKVSFESLRAPGGLRVSAELRGGTLIRAELLSPVERKITFSAPGIAPVSLRLQPGVVWRYQEQATTAPRAARHLSSPEERERRRIS